MKNKIPFKNFILHYRKEFSIAYIIFFIATLTLSIISNYASGYIVSVIFALIYTFSMLWDWKDFRKRVPTQQLNEEDKQYGL